VPTVRAGHGGAGNNRTTSATAMKTIFNTVLTTITFEPNRGLRRH
jgi:hypothetical protein